MENIINQLGTNNLDVNTNGIQIPLKAQGKILHIKQKTQLNAVGKFLGIKHAYAVIELEENMGFFQQSKTYYLLCDYGLSTQLVSISQEDAAKGETLKSVKIKKGITFQNILDISNNFTVENGDYKLLENNCSHFVKYLQTNLQQKNQSTDEMDKFTDKQVQKGIETGVKVAATAIAVGGLLFKGLQQIQENANENKQKQNAQRQQKQYIDGNQQQYIRQQQQQQQSQYQNNQSTQYQNYDSAQNIQNSQFQNSQDKQQNTYQSKQYNQSNIQNQQLYEGYQKYINQSNQQKNTNNNNIQQNFDYDAFQQQQQFNSQQQQQQQLQNSNQQDKSQAYYNGNSRNGNHNSYGQSNYSNYY